MGYDPQAVQAKLEALLGTPEENASTAVHARLVAEYGDAAVKLHSIQRARAGTAIKPDTALELCEQLGIPADDFVEATEIPVPAMERISELQEQVRTLSKELKRSHSELRTLREERKTTTYLFARSLIAWIDEDDEPLPAVRAAASALATGERGSLAAAVTQLQAGES